MSIEANCSPLCYLEFLYLDFTALHTSYRNLGQRTTMTSAEVRILDTFISEKSMTIRNKIVQEIPETIYQNKILVKSVI